MSNPEYPPEPATDVGQRMHEFAAALYPTCRSITGEGTRQTLRAIQERIGIEIREVSSGTPAFDWVVPDEWNIREAYIADLNGRRIVDMADHNLHVLNYSEPVNTTVQLAELRSHLHSLPDQPDLIPYRTSYYQRQWGFCLPHSLLETMSDDAYKVVIDSTITPGVLNYGELLIPGKTDDEVLFSTHICHPSLANDNLSGIALLTELAGELAAKNNRYSYRFVFVPGTIGSITWLSRNRSSVAKIQHGLVVACVGDPGHFHYKRSRRGNAEIDKIVESILRRSDEPYSIRDFSPYGYDERQYCSPGFNLAVGSLTKTPHGKYPEYHTSADNLDLITPAALKTSFDCYMKVIDTLDQNRTYENLFPKCEPQLGRRGLYSMMGGYADAKDDQMAMLWVLNLSDGSYSLLEIAERSGMEFERLARVAEVLAGEGLIA